MSATRSASGPMLAPRIPAPMSVGAPMRVTFLFMRRLCRSDVERELARLVVGLVVAVFGDQQRPRFLGGLDEMEQPGVAGRDHPGLDEQVEVDQPGPELAAEEQDRPHPR